MKGNIDMSNLDNIIADITEVNSTYGFWIRDEHGNLKNNVICGEVIPFLESLKEFEVDMPQSEIKDMINFWDSNIDVSRYTRDNTYNHGANIDHDIDYRIVESEHDGTWLALMVHRYGDVRGNYTDWAVCKFDSIYEFWELASETQCKTFGEDDRYCADINIFSECYNVYDTLLCEDVGFYYETEVCDLLDSIAESEGEN